MNRVSRQLCSKLLSSSFAHKSTCSGLQYTTSSGHRSRFGICFDVDGVLIQGKHVIPQAKQAIDLLSHNGLFSHPVLFVTNSSAKDSDKAKSLTSYLDIPVSIDHIVHAQSPLSAMTSYHSKHMLVLGQGDLKTKAEDLGFSHVSTIEDVNAAFPLLDVTDHSVRDNVNGQQVDSDVDFPRIEGLILMGEPARWGSALQIAIDVIQTRGFMAIKHHGSDTHNEPPVDVFACNPDLLYKHKADLPRYGQGAFLLALEELHKKTLGYPLIYKTILGKPSEATFCYAEHRLNLINGALGNTDPVTHLYMVGDNPCADIAGANLYNRYISTGRRPSSIPTYRQLLPQTNTTTTNDHQYTYSASQLCAKEVQSILVCTGVYQHQQHGSSSDSASDLSLLHSHRDFVLDESLVTANVVCPTVLEAVQYILSIHR